MYVILSSLLIHWFLIVVCKKIEYNTSTHIGVYRKKKVVVIVLFVDTMTLTFGFIEDQQCRFLFLFVVTTVLIRIPEVSV